jgi:plasmid stability protein
MAVVTVRNLPEETHRALKLRAAQHGRSTEAEIREILEQAVKPQQRLRMGSTLAEIGRRSQVRGEDLAAALKRDRTPAVPMRLE